VSKIDGGLRSLFHKNLKQAQWSAVETGMVAQGIPDSEFCFPGGRQGWLEYKRANGNSVRVRPLQVAWIEKRIRLGGRAFVAVVRGGDLTLFRGEAIRHLKEGGISAVPDGLVLGTWGGGPRRWNWAEIQTLLGHRI